MSVRQSSIRVGRIWVILLVAACAPSPAPPPTPIPTETPTTEPIEAPTVSPLTGTVEVQLSNIAFQPADISVGVGTTVRWIQEDSVSHTTTSETGAWQSGTMEEGATFAFTFTEPGVYPYFCEFHAGMKGSITVVGSGAGSYYSDY